MIRYGILVIYNKEISESASYLSLKKQGLRIVVVDNSTKANDNKKLVEKDGNIYISMNGNAGLSKAYNKAVQYIQLINEKKDFFVLLVDDDTQFQEDFIVKAEKEINQKDGDIYLPIVKAGEHVISPCLCQYNEFKEVHSVFSIPKEKISGINSGMIVSIQAYDKAMYDENMFLDYIDHAFIREQKRKGSCIEMINVEIHQDFSVLNNDKSANIQRLNILKKDLMVYYKEDKNKVFKILFKRKLRHILQFKDISVLWKC